MAQKRGTPPDIAQMQTHEENFRRELRTKYGNERADDIFTGTVEWLEDHPAVRAVVELPGFGATPAGQQFLEQLVAHVMRTEHV
jgi:hypothetical protein